MNPTIRGAARSKMIWLNLALALYSAIELASAHLTTLFGQRVTAAILLGGSLLNVVLRVYTTSSLAEKSGE